MAKFCGNCGAQLDDGDKAVSYTHLDVYKRQTLYRWWNGMFYYR